MYVCPEQLSDYALQGHRRSRVPDKNGEIRTTLEDTA